MSLKKNEKRKDKKKDAEKNKLPKEVLALFENEGVKTDGFIMSVAGDMDNEGCYCSLWMAFDEKGLYLAFGAEKIKKKKGNKRLKAEYSLTSLNAIPIDDVEKLKTEKYVATGRLIAEENGEDVSMTKFSIGFLAAFENLCQCFNDYKEGKDISHYTGEDMEGLHCPKCGEKYPDKSKVCPKCTKKSSTVKRLFKFFGGYIWQVIVITVSILFGTAVTLIAPKISTQMLFDDVFEKTGEIPAETLIKSLIYIVLAICAIRLLDMLFKLVYQYIIEGIMPKIIYDIKVKIFKAMQRLSVGYYSSKQTGALMERVTEDATNIYWFFVDGLPYVFVNGMTIIGVLVMMVLISWKLTLLTLAIAPVLMLMLVFGEKIFRRLHHRRWTFSARMNSIVSDNINGQRVIKAFSRENEELERFSTASKNLKEAQIKLVNMESTAYPILYALVSLLTTAVLVLGGILTVRGEITVGSLLTFIIYLGMIQSPFEFFSWISNWWSRCVDSSQRVFEIVDAEAEITESENPVSIEKFNGKIEISELEFEYEPARPIIKRLNLTANAGEMLGIVGKTGAGKTTIANLISRLYDAKEGTIKIDGIDVKDLPLEQLRKNIGLVSQDIYLFIGTIADNIRYAKPDATMAQVIAAAKASSAHDFIMKLPDAYETRVGAGGQDLSGGERQRISIARTIIQNPKILILDEATAAMDTATERNIQESLTKLKEGRTTIAIAHRLSTLRDSDMLAVIDDGKVVEYGTFAELIRQKGEFYKLYKIQSEALKTVSIGDD